MRNICAESHFATNSIRISSWSTCNQFSNVAWSFSSPEMASSKKKGSKGSLDKGKPHDGDKAEKTERNSFDSEIRELFRLFDTNNDKTINCGELGKAMRFLGMSPTQQEVQEAITLLDKNENGKIDFQEFYAFMQSEIAKISDSGFMQNQENIRSAFKTFDKDGNGFIDASELRVAMKKLGECLTDRELDDMMRDADVDGDGKINYEEFVRVWCGSS